MSNGTSFPWALLLIPFALGIASYVFVGFCLMKMAEKLGVENGWFAFIPFLNIWLICQMAEKENTWFVLMLIFSFCCGIVTTVMMILCLMDISEKLGFENYWGILTIIPIFNYYVFYKLAFTEP